MRVPERLGSAETEVLLKLTSRDRAGTWSRSDGTALYEGNRALTQMLCERLTVRGYLDEKHHDDRIEYRVNREGKKQAAIIRVRRG